VNRNIIISILIYVILGLIGFMVYDLFYSENSHQNVYELDTDGENHINPELIDYTEINQIKTNLTELNGIAIDANDQIIIAGNEVQIYDRNLKLVKRFNPTDTINCVTVNSNNELYLGVKHRIEVRDFSGNLLRSWDLVNSESIITGIAATDKHIYVADADARLVYQYDTEGKLLAHLGKGNAEKGIPDIIIRSSFFDVSIGRDGELWMANPGHYLLQAFDTKGNFISSWGEQSNSVEGFCGCCNPTNFAILSNGNFVTSEKSIPRVKIYSPDGKFLSVVAPPGKFDKGTKGLDLAVDSKNNIYVLDPERKQIRIFEKNIKK